MRPNTLNPEYKTDIFISLRKQAKSDMERKRFQAMEFAAAGLERKFINQSLNLGRNTLGIWISKVNRLGPESLYTSPGQGAPRRLDDSQLKQIIKEVQGNPRALGFRQSNWDGRMIMRRIRSSFGIDCSPRTIYNILKRGGLTKQRPTRLYGECDEETKAEFKKKSVKQ